MQKLENELFAAEDSIVSEILIKEFEEIIGGSLDEVASKNENSHEKKMTLFTNQVHPAHKIKLEELIFIKKLGIF